MLILCNKCNQTTDCRLLKGTETVMCSGCGEEVTNVTHFTVGALQSNRDYVDTKTGEGFAFPCQGCAVRRPGVVDRKTNAVVCSTCGEQMNVTTFMAETMKAMKLFKGE